MIKIILFISFLNFYCLPYRLNVPKVLLPYYSSVPVNFTLEISDPNSIDGGGGCFSWKSSRPEIVSILTGNKCSDSALVSAISPHRQKLTAVVYAEDTLSDVILRCDVMVDVINEIEIITTTRELFLEDAPEMFLVRAKNDQDDTFSTLDGLIFDWRLEQTEKILKFVQFSDSKYETTTAIQRLEDVGRRGYQVLVEGVNTGRASLSAQLKDNAYADVSSHKINLAVVAHLTLNPSMDLYLPVGVNVHYEVQLLKQSRVENVTMPSPQYFLSLSDDYVCTLNEMTSVVTTNRLGTTEISLKNKNDDFAASVRMPSAFIRVVDPISLKFVVQPGQNWVLEVGRTYEIYLNLYDSEKHQLFVTKDMDFRATLSEEYFEIIFWAKNSSYFVVKPIRRGKTELNGEFETLRTLQKVEIFDPLVISPDLAIFPFDPSGKTYHLPLKVEGGSSSVTFTSDNRPVASVAEQTGNVVAGMNYGSATITATDQRNRLHTANMRVVVLDVTGFEIGDGPREVELGSIVQLPIRAFAEVSFSPVRRVMITNCTHLKFDVRSNDPDMFDVLDASSVDKSLMAAEHGCCCVIPLLAKTIGDTKILVILNRRDLPPLESRLTLSVFEPLKVINPLSAHLLLAPGSSWVVKYSGGPRPWSLDSSGYFTNVENDKEGAIEINLLSKNKEILPSSIATFDVFCKNYAETELLLSVGNAKSVSNPFPVVVAKKIKVTCDVPDKIVLLSANQEHAGFPPCPLTKSTHTIPVHFQNPTSLRLLAFDKSQRKFDNISSLVPVWRTSDASLVEISDKISFLKETESFHDGKSVLESSYTVKPLGKLGTTTLTVEIKSFSLSNCLDQKCLKSLKNRLTTTSNLVLTDYHKIQPEYLSLFNHPLNKLNLHIANGSGYFYVPLTEREKEMVFVNLIDSTMELTPKKDGELALNVYDLCLNVERPSISHVYISSIAKIRLVGPELVEIQKEIVVNIILLDRHDREMVGNFLHLLDLQIVLDNSVLSVRLVNGQRNCTVRGLNVGTGSYVVTVSQNHEPKIVRSNNHVVQVFSPLELRPKRVTLITGAKFQLEVFGGPQTSGVLSFVLNDTSIASVREDGLIEAFKLGHVLITGHIYGSRGVSSQLEIIGEDSVQLDVVSLSGIKIRLPSPVIYVGTEMNVHVVGLTPSNTPMSWGSVEHPLIFEWSVDDQKAVSLGFIHLGIELTEPLYNQFTRRISCLDVGLVTLKVKVTAHVRSKQHFLHGSKVFTDSVQLRILEALQVISPPGLGLDNSLIMTPNTGIQLKLNSNGAVVRYVPHPAHLVSVNSEGFLQTFEQTGQATVFVTVAGRVPEANETLTINLFVETVHHIQLNAVSKFRLTEDIFHLPVGYTMDYSVSAHDLFARTFHASNLALKFRPNRFDLTEITADYTNRSLSVYLKHVGETVLKVWDDQNNKQLVDYIRITAGAALKPDQKTLTVGDLVCFDTFIDDETAVGDSWSSGKRNVMDILSTAGVAVAISSGETTISHSVDRKLTTNLNLNVVEPNKIEFLTYKLPKFVGAFNLDFQGPIEIPILIKRSSNQTANIFGEHGHQYPCIQRLKSLKDSSTTLNGWLLNPPFTCKLSFEDESVNAYQLLSVAAVFSLNSGSYACSITPSTLRDVISQYSRFESALIVVAAWASRSSGETKLSDAIRLPFYSPYVVQPTDIWLDNLQNPVKVLTVKASPTQENYLKITSNMENVVKISKRTKDAQGGDDTIEYAIELLVDSTNIWQKDLSGLHLIILSELTNQQTKVPLVVKLYGPTPKGLFARAKPTTVWSFMDMLIENYGSAFLVLITIVVTIAAMYFGYRAVYNGGDIPPSAQFSQTNSPSGISPSFIQWKAFGKQSPTGQPIASPTQQYPYLWSLSRSQTPPDGSSSNYSFR